jgi:hypothetical protein
MTTPSLTKTLLNHAGALEALQRWQELNDPARRA